MLQPVRPSLLFWNIVGLFSSFSFLYAFLKLEFVVKSSGQFCLFLKIAISFLWLVAQIVILYLEAMVGYSKMKNLFQGYERIAKVVAVAILFFGNVGLYYYSEKSVACLFTFLSLALFFLCVLFMIQPYTDFGVLEFLLSACINVALSHFGIRHVYSWLVLSACIVIAGLRYWLEPPLPAEIVTLQSQQTNWIHLSSVSELELNISKLAPSPGFVLKPEPNLSISAPLLGLKSQPELNRSTADSLLSFELESNSDRSISAPLLGLGSVQTGSRIATIP